MQTLGKGVHAVDYPLTLASSLPGKRGMVTPPFFVVYTVNQTVNIPPGV